jgi:hypothetical protein
MKMKTTILLAASFVLAAGANAATVISYNWDFNGGIGGPSQFAGVVSAANWNNSYTISTTANPQSGSPWSNLIDNSGATTTMDISFNSPNQYRANPSGGTPGQDADGTYNRNLLNGYADMSGGIAVTVNLAEIPYALYDIYIYMSSDTADREGYVADDGGLTYYFRTLGSAAVTGSNASLIQTLDLTDDAVDTAASYAKFSSLSGASQAISVFAAGNAGIAGIQVVQIPEPSAALLGGLGMLALLRRRRA